MANYQYTADLLEDILFRAEELPGVSLYRDAALRYLNRVYQAIWTGGAEFSSQVNEDWHWLRTPDPVAIQQAPIYDTGTIAATQFSNAVTFSAAPNRSLAGDVLRVRDARNLYRILTHNAAETTAMLDAPYLDETVTAHAFASIKVVYALPDDFMRFSQPMRMWHGQYYIDGVDEDTLDAQFPLAKIAAGLPQQFALIAEKIIRFSHGGSDRGDWNRLEYHYLQRPNDLTDPGTTEEPLVPRQYRRLLADGAVYWVLTDKNDARATRVGESFQAGIRAMVADNRYQAGKMDSTYGRILTRTPARSRPQWHHEDGTRTGMIRP